MDRRGRVERDDWDRENPSLMTVRAVLAAVPDEGLVPLVWFDANAGYLTAGQYLRPGHDVWGGVVRLKPGKPARTLLV